MASVKKPSQAPQHPAESEFKGGGDRGGPRRWTGKGPRPARHIPWPEIFKHHISLIEGHTKMIDMVRKHTVPNTGNWRTIVAMLDRSHEIMKIAKAAARDFVPPPNHRDQVPIGSSSASMYPGYSPADHVYGQAAEEFGLEWQQAKQQGYEFAPKPDGPQYEFGQAGGIKRRTLAQIRDAKAARGEPTKDHAASKAPTQAKEAGEESTTSNAATGNPFFVVDTNPTPVSMLESEQKSKSNRRNSDDEAAMSRSKRPKKEHADANGTVPIPKIEYEDISEEVDQRLKEKEERRRRKEKKRKRESEASITSKAHAEDVPNHDVDESSKPKKKKSKRSDDKGSSAASDVKTKKRHKDHDQAEGRTKKKKKVD